jgi:hypothetical protein
LAGASRFGESGEKRLLLVKDMFSRLDELMPWAWAAERSSRLSA